MCRIPDTAPIGMIVIVWQTSIPESVGKDSISINKGIPFEGVKLIHHLRCQLLTSAMKKFVIRNINEISHFASKHSYLVSWYTLRIMLSLYYIVREICSFV